MGTFIIVRDFRWKQNNFLIWIHVYESKQTTDLYGKHLKKKKINCFMGGASMMVM